VKKKCLVLKGLLYTYLYRVLSALTTTKLTSFAFSLHLLLSGIYW